MPFAVKKTLLPCRINHNVIIDEQLTERFELIKKSFGTTAASDETTTKIYSHSPNTITLISPLNWLFAFEGVGVVGGVGRVVAG